MTTLNLQSSPMEPDRKTADAETTHVMTSSTEPDASASDATGKTKDRMHFSEWWSEYQKKMKTAFQGDSLKLQLQGQS